MADEAGRLAQLQGRDLLPADTVAVALVGSLARGWANPESDVDIAVFTSSNRESATATPLSVPLDPGHVTSETFTLGERKWEVVYWLTDQVDQMLNKVSWTQFERNVVAHGLLHPREENLVARLQHGVPLLGEGWLAEAHQRVSDSAFQSFMVTRSLAVSDDAVEDAVGQLEAGALESAVLSARQALDWSVDALLESRGEYLSLIPKWRPQRFRAASPPSLTFERYWELESMQTYDSDDPAAWVHEVLEVCQVIALGIDVRP